MCWCSPMQRNVWTVPIHHRHNAKFEIVAAHRCKETSRPYRLTIGTPRNLHVLLLADAKKCLDCTTSPEARREIYMCCCSPMQRNVSTVRTHHRHTGAATTFRNPFPLGLPAKTANSNDFYRREYLGKPKPHGNTNLTRTGETEKNLTMTVLGALGPGRTTPWLWAAWPSLESS